MSSKITLSDLIRCGRLRHAVTKLTASAIILPPNSSRKISDGGNFRVGISQYAPDTTGKKNAVLLDIDISDEFVRLLLEMVEKCGKPLDETEGKCSASGSENITAALPEECLDLAATSMGNKGKIILDALDVEDKSASKYWLQPTESEWIDGFVEANNSNISHNRLVNQQSKKDAFEFFEPLNLEKLWNLVKRKRQRVREMRLNHLLSNSFEVHIFVFNLARCCRSLRCNDVKKRRLLKRR